VSCGLLILLLIFSAGNPLITVARIFVTALVAFSYPLQAHPARTGLLSLIAAMRKENEDEISEQSKWIRYLVVTVSATSAFIENAYHLMLLIDLL
jgi:hypothetical protein